MPDSVTPVDCSPSGFPIQGILQARILDWVVISFSKQEVSNQIIIITKEKKPLRGQELYGKRKQKKNNYYSYLLKYKDGMTTSGNNQKGIVLKEQKSRSWKLKTSWQKRKTLTDRMEG